MTLLVPTTKATEVLTAGPVLTIDAQPQCVVHGHKVRDKILLSGRTGSPRRRDEGSSNIVLRSTSKPAPETRPYTDAKDQARERTKIAQRHLLAILTTDLGIAGILQWESASSALIAENFKMAFR